MEIILDKDVQPLVVHIVDETNTDLGNVDKSTIVINGLMAEIIKLNIEKEHAQTKCDGEHKRAEYLQRLIDERKAADEKIRTDKIEEDNRKAKIAEQKRLDKVAEAERLYEIKMEEEEKKRQAKEQEDIRKKETEENIQMWITIGTIGVAIVGAIGGFYSAKK